MESSPLLRNARCLQHAVDGVTRYLAGVFGAVGRKTDPIAVHSAIADRDRGIACS